MGNFLSCSVQNLVDLVVGATRRYASGRGRHEVITCNQDLLGDPVISQIRSCFTQALLKEHKSSGVVRRLAHDD